MQKVYFWMLVSVVFAAGCAKPAISGTVQVSEIDSIEFCGQRLSKDAKEVVCEDGNVNSVEPLASLSNLESLDISAAGVSGLETVSKFTSLKVLWISQGAFSKEQIDQLKQALPELKISQLFTCSK